jgi:hypothetical protein
MSWGPFRRRVPCAVAMNNFAHELRDRWPRMHACCTACIHPASASHAQCSSSVRCTFTLDVLVADRVSFIPFFRALNEVVLINS